jgi:hypothetical protein
MADALRSELLFRRSSRCSAGGCVEVALLPDGGAAVRNSTARTYEPLVFRQAAVVSLHYLCEERQF